MGAQPEPLKGHPVGDQIAGGSVYQELFGIVSQLVAEVMTNLPPGDVSVR